MACWKKSQAAAAFLLALLSYSHIGALAENPTLRCRGFDGTDYVLDVGHSKVYSVFSAKDHQLNALFVNKAISGLNQESVVIPELGLLYSEAGDEPMRVHARALTNGTLEVHLNNRKYVDRAMFQGSLDINPCPPEDLERLELRGQPDDVVVIITPLITLYAWAKPAADPRAPFGEVLLRLIVNVPESRKGEYTGILGSTMHTFLKSYESAAESTTHAEAPLPGGVAPSERHLGEQHAARAPADKQVEAEPYALPALFSADHDSPHRDASGSQSASRKLMNLHGWVNGHMRGLLPPRQHSLTRRNLRMQSKPVSMKNLFTSKQGGQTNSQMKLSQKLEDPYNILADPVTHTQPGNKQLGSSTFSEQPAQLESDSPYLGDSTVNLKPMSEQPVLTLDSQQAKASPLPSGGISAQSPAGGHEIQSSTEHKVAIPGAMTDLDESLLLGKHEWVHPDVEKVHDHPYFTLYGQVYDPYE